MDIINLEVNMLEPKDALTYQHVIVWPYDWVTPTLGCKLNKDEWLVDLHSSDDQIVKADKIRGWLPMPKWKASEKGPPVAIFSIDKRYIDDQGGD